MMMMMMLAVPAGAITKLSVARDKKGPIGAIQQSDTIDVRVLAARVAESHTVPAGAKYVIFSCVDSNGTAASFWADFDGTAAIPSADITDGSGCEVNPAVRYVGNVSTISLIAPAACIVTMSFYDSVY